MSITADLEGLARLNGIQPEYLDVFKQRHETSEATLRALLEAMGVTDLDAGARSAEERRWQRLLPPVGVYGEGQPIEVPLSMPSGGNVVEWRIRLEDGRDLEGKVAPASLRLIEAGTFEGRGFERRGLRLPDAMPLGYHRLHVEGPGERGDNMSIIVGPERCYGVEESAGEPRVWGVAAQIYGLRSDRNWGMGDFADLAASAEEAARIGADILGINPVHATFPADPHHFAPYAPSNRAFLNYLYISVEDLPEFEHCGEARDRVADPEFQDRVRATRAAELVDYIAVAELKRPLLELLFRCFQAGVVGPEHRRTFDAFREEIGPALERHALFDALHEHFFRAGYGEWSWREWPEPFRRCDSAEVAAFAAEHQIRIDFFAWLQWSADRQLGEAQRRARAAGMRIGLYRDLAVAAHPGGSATWMDPDTVVYGASVGAPPDELAPDGQNWGIAPLSPEALRERAYQPFITALRANMRHAGALRIDHAMALERLFCIPAGMSGADGAYVAYPRTDLLRIIALESCRARCVVIGEDLGTVPEGFQAALQRAGVLSYRILMFERSEGGGFKPPEEYPRQALAAPATHDLPTLAGFWAGRDLDWREKLSQTMSDDDKARARAQRQSDRGSLLQALEQAGEGVSSGAADAAGLRRAVYRFLARSPANILMIPIEDLDGELEQPNLPGTTDEHPNWRRKLSRSTREIFADPAVRSLAEAVRCLRRGQPAHKTDE